MFNICGGVERIPGSKFALTGPSVQDAKASCVLISIKNKIKERLYCSIKGEILSLKTFSCSWMTFT